MRKFEGFTADHVGEKVYDINLGRGEITSYSSREKYGVLVTFPKGNVERYMPNGHCSVYGRVRTLYFGHNIKVEVTGEEVPEPALICPVCGIDHEIKVGCLHSEFYYFADPCGECPFEFSSFGSIEQAKEVMRRLIKAMQTSKEK